MNTSTSLLKKKKKITIERGHPLFALNEEQGRSNSSLETTKQNWNWNDQVRKRQKRSSMNVTEDGEKHSVIWWMFMSGTLEASVFMGKEYSENLHSIKKTKDLTMKQLLDISAKLVSEQDEIYGVKTIGWENYSWKY